ncbi:MAG: Ubiquinone/menaquinone biosynthesis C-methyltransferase UbiE [Alphaproteobacteria bacterium MarineAlpha2_Bin1]|nr:MAG: Ubiquinone/menaquinone biosynthesis C-methyltransferase UbiE [Alphaproteobacteria bacterium MarineAlpha2_Bin1]
MGSIKNISNMLKPNHDEISRQKFVSILRKKILVDFASDMKFVYKNKVEPNFENLKLRKPKNGREIRKYMLKEMIFKGWSSLRYNAQLMTWLSVKPCIERNLEGLIEESIRIHNLNPSGGSLSLNQDVKVPREITELDIHLMPGCFHTEYTENDVTQGALYHYGTSVFSGGLQHRKLVKGSVGTSIANYLKIAFPDFLPSKILDVGCTAGANTIPYGEIFSNAEIHGIDIGAGLLRFAHARAEAENIPIHFHQKNAIETDFPDDTFDFITSSFFFHEVSVKDTHKILKECFRILKPGGLMLHMELPPSSETDPYYNFYLDWDAFYNNEPHYLKFRELDFKELLTKAGFNKNKLLFSRIPNYPSTPIEEFKSSVINENTQRRDHGNGAVWYTFGAWK